MSDDHWGALGQADAADAQQRVADAYVIRAAARALKRRSTRKKSFWLGVILRVLHNAANRIESEHG